jgi:hypothetical protein
MIGTTRVRLATRQPRRFLALVVLITWAALKRIGVVMITGSIAAY